MSALTDILPAKVRRIAYAAYAGVGLAIGATQVGFIAADVSQPTWLNVTLAVTVFLGTGLGLTAASNTSASAAEEATGLAAGNDYTLEPYIPRHKVA
jgi:hypothetical protein